MFTGDGFLNLVLYFGQNGKQIVTCFLLLLLLLLLFVCLFLFCFCDQLRGGTFHFLIREVKILTDASGHKQNL